MLIIRLFRIPVSSIYCFVKSIFYSEVCLTLRWRRILSLTSLCALASSSLYKVCASVHSMLLKDCYLFWASVGSQNGLFFNKNEVCSASYSLHARFDSFALKNLKRFKAGAFCSSLISWTCAWLTLSFTSSLACLIYRISVWFGDFDLLTCGVF